MDRRQWIVTLTAVAVAVLLGVGITLAVTSGGPEGEVSIGPPTTTTQPSTTTVPRVPTAPPSTTARTLPPTIPTAPRPSVVVNTTARPTVAPTTPPTTPPTVHPTTPPTSPPTTAQPTEATTTTTAARQPATTSTTAPSTTTTRAPALVPGVSATEIRLGVLSDHAEAAQGVQAWATWVNRRGGLQRRAVRIDVYEVGADAARYRDAVTAACAKDFALVGSSSVVDGDVAGIVGCGLPDLPARTVTAAHRAGATTYAAMPTSATKQLVGPFAWLLANVPSCCAQYVVESTDPVARAITQQSALAALSIGFTSVGATELPDDAPQSAYAAVVDAMASRHATFGRSDLGFESTVKLRKQAAAQGLTSVNAWFCLAQCYRSEFLAEGGTAVDGEYVQLPVKPFEDAGSIPALRAYLRYTRAGGAQPSIAGLESFVAGMLFEQAERSAAAIAGRTGITRTALLDAVKAINAFDAGGIMGPTQVGNREPNGCFVLLRVQKGTFTRVTPSSAGQISCGAQNLALVGP